MGEASGRRRGSIVSTNYYLLKNHCEHCGRADRQHIGKRSGGWRFLFRSYPGIMSAADWKRETASQLIVDEYGDEVSPVTFWDSVVADTVDENLNHYDYCNSHGMRDHAGFKDDEGWPFSADEFS